MGVPGAVTDTVVIILILWMGSQRPENPSQAVCSRAWGDPEHRYYNPACGLDQAFLSGPRPPCHYHEGLAGWSLRAPSAPEIPGEQGLRQPCSVPLVPGTVLGLGGYSVITGQVKEGPWVSLKVSAPIATDPGLGPR